MLPPTARPAILRSWNRLVGREPLSWQEELEADTHRNVLVVIGRRGGKTDEASTWLVAGTAFDGLPGCCFAPDYEKADYVFSGAWLAARRTGFLEPRTSSQHEGRLVLRRRAAGRPGGVIERRSADAKSGNVGFALRRLVWDEVCRTRHGRRIWGQDLRPTLTDYRGEALWITTPSGWDHVHELYQRIKSGREPDWGVIQAPSWCNHHVYPGGRDDPELVAIEREYKEAGLEEMFRQEYGAEFVVIEGLLLKKWKPSEMVVPHAAATANVATWYLGYDWGFDHPAVYILLGRTSGGQWRAVDEDYGTEESPEEIQNRALLILRRNGLGIDQIERLYYDPSRPEQGVAFRRMGFAASPARPYDSASRVLAMASAIGKPGGFLVSNRCKRLPVELSMLRKAPDSPSGVGSNQLRVVKVQDDGFDAAAGVMAAVRVSDERAGAESVAYERGMGVRQGAPRSLR